MRAVVVVVLLLIYMIESCESKHVMQINGVVVALATYSGCLARSDKHLGPTLLSSFSRTRDANPLDAFTEISNGYINSITWLAYTPRTLFDL
mgnify:CR=1 FL=1